MGVESTALSSARRLPFICSQLLRMHSSRWAAPPIPSSPHDLLVRIGLCTVLYCGVFANRGLTGHTEVVRVVFSPKDVSLEELLKRFWESHDPTQGMRQQNDRGTQYRSAIYTSNPTQQELALRSKVAFQQELDKKSYGRITTEILEGQPFYYAEDYHQQYLKKVPNGYCGLKGTGVSCPIGAGKDEL
ncbi:mitochondrial peptide methionine sulfoxide reductase isoform X4 [Etheostoma cragini]|uniref:mitochondrial peptide methionine sulfoxide reductase isoform X4 n=1 Tax=Etheostoma cragini TaxID=417921 RepID=UPI00155DE095|nr:mitochondrial peptide methionine sulfoxide reductase isoform X4 [Etheostoma cragini]